MTVSLLLAACLPPAVERGESGAFEDTAAMVYTTETPEPTLSVDEVGAILDAVIALGAPDPDEIAETYEGLMGLGGERCPGADLELYEPEGGCMTDDDTLYSGVAWYDIVDTMVDDIGETVELSWIHGGDFEILTRDGARFAGGGEVTMFSRWEDTVLISDIDMAGTWVDNQRSDWLGQTMSGVWLATSRVAPTGTAFTLTGGLTLGDHHLFLNQLTWDDEDACAGEATGAISVRDDRGYWYLWELGEDCDDCGPLTFHDDQEQGELCLDLSGWGEDWRASSAPH